MIRDGKVIGATLLGDSKKVAFLQQAFDRGLPLPEARVELLFDLGGPSEEVGVAEMADDAQVCNCNGVCKGRIVDTVKAGCKTVTGVMDKTRAGKGCGSCKELVAQIVEFAAGGAVEEDPAVHYYVPGIPMDKPTLMADDPRTRPAARSSAVFAALAPDGAEDAKSKMGLASLLKMMWGERVRRRARRPVHQRPGARQHPEGRHLLGRPADAGRGHHSRAAAPDRRRGREVRRADGQAHRRSADRPAGHQEGGPAEGLGRPRTCRRATRTASRSGP